MGRIFLPVTGRQHDKRSIEVAALLGLERSDTVHIFHAVPDDSGRVAGEKLVDSIEATVETYGVSCRKDVGVGGAAELVTQRLKSGEFSLGVLSIRSSRDRSIEVISERMKGIIRDVRECPLILVQESDVL